ncbi:uncharacterized protein SCODWIG_03989 [Saccharomycodes ludwigii]|uniref:Uncharacterized protein n=1 Tax=Saccharomycodes ludwigii TaxID=36035 RepID=A0A376BC77_9ASCO|nr:uncharacterized protein SCODWIG_03989 [Saccharomycodes ludwigii]
MQYKKSVITASLATLSAAAYVPGDNWSTLTPTATYSGAISNYASTFGIAVIPITTGSYASLATSTASVAKRDVQAVSQIGDGQIQATTSTAAAAKTTAQAVSQIGDGQIQATTSTAAATKTTAQAVSQIGDGQIQATTKLLLH